MSGSVSISMARRRLAVLALTLALTGGGDALAQGSITGGRDTSQPIEITADSLEVQQDKQVAIFRGNVDAVQGDIRLRADVLQVHYRQQGDSQPAGKTAPARSGAKPPPSNGGSDLAAGGAISRIDARGSVFVSSPEETARGDTGVYDVDRRVIVLEGREVVLTRGKNVIKGQRATMNLDTGRSVMDGAGQSGRVRGLFVPQQNQQNQQNQQPERRR